MNRYLSILLFLFCVTASAQNISLGVTASAFRTSFAFAPPGKFTGKNNFGVGITMLVPLNSRFSVDARLLYTNMNVAINDSYYRYLQNNDPLVVNGKENKVKQSYWEVPVGIRYSLTTESKVNWFISAGISQSFQSRAYIAGDTAKIDGTGKRLFGTFLSVGMSFKVHDKLRLGIETVSRAFIDRYGDYRDTPVLLGCSLTLLREFQ
jgi:hypothetical protein